MRKAKDRYTENQEEGKYTRQGMMEKKEEEGDGGVLWAFFRGVSVIWHPIPRLPPKTSVLSLIYGGAKKDSRISVKALEEEEVERGKE